ncbi:MAG: hypothetical protein EOP50_20695, partial [Sphingobacteriales bacterium]
HSIIATQPLNLALFNATDNYVLIDNTGNFTIAVPITQSSTGYNFGRAGTGTGVLILTNGSNTYTGQTRLLAGTIRPTVAGALPAATTVNFTNASGTNAVLDLSTAGISHTVTALSGGNSNSSITFITNTGTLTLNGGAATSTTTYSGIITGTGKLAKSGSTIQVLTGNNTFTGTTTITGGELRFLPAGAGTYASQILLNGGTLGTTGIASSASLTSSSSLQLLASSNINLGSNPHSLVFAASNGVGWTAGQTILVNGWTGSNGTSGTGGKLFVGNSATGLTSGQLAQIQFVIGGNNVAAMQMSTGEVVPVTTGPTVTTTLAPSSITESSAITGGSTITGTVTAKGAVWNTATAPT